MTTYKEKLLKRLEKAEVFEYTTISVQNKGSSDAYVTGDIEAVNFLGKLLIRFKGVEVPLEKIDSSEIYGIMKSRYSEYEIERIAKILEEL